MKKKWDEVSEDARQFFKDIGGFSPTAHADARELKGYIKDEDGYDCKTYWNSDELRAIAEYFTEVADWLDKRKEG